MQQPRGAGDTPASIFRIHLADALRPLSDPVAIQGEAARLLGEHLGANRVAYFEVLGADYVVARDYVAGARPIAGRFPVTSFGAKLLAAYHAGRAVVAPNVDADPDLAPAERAAFAALQIGAYVGVPLIKDDQFVAGLAVHMAAPRTWSPDEVALIEEVAERTWAAVERARAEAALRASEAKYRSLFESMDEGFCIMQLIFDDTQQPVDYRFVEINPVFAQQTGMQHALGRTIRELVPAIEPFWFAIYGAVALTGEPTRFVDHAPSLDRWFDVYAFRIGAPDERLVAVLFNDITARKRREAHLAFLADIANDFSRLSAADEIMQTVGAKLGAYLHIATCSFVDVDDARGDLTVRSTWNRSDVPSLLGTYRIDDYLTEAFARSCRAGEMVVVCDTQTDERTNEQAYAAYDIHAFITVPFRRNGVWTHHLAVSDSRPRAWRGDELELIGELASRIFPRIERARAEEALRASEARLQQLYAQEQAARAQAEEASQLKDEFLATVSHELRTPLTAFLGYAGLLQRRTHDAAYVARTVAKMVESAQAQATLIDDLLDVSRIVSGKLRIEPEPLALSDVIHAALDTVRPTLEAKGMEVAVMLDPAASATLGDANRLQQVVWNLLANAAKFTPPGGRIAVELTRAGGNAELTVRDTGQGIPPDFLPYVFDRFRQADSSSQRAYSGLGLGLALVRHLVELHGGTVAVTSDGVGKGATFTVRLPLASKSDLTELAQAVAGDADASGEALLPLAGLQVLVVDDQPAIRELIAEMLAFDGATAQICATAAEALALLQRWRPDVLVSDIAMPGEDGYWLIEQVRRLTPEEGGATPAVALTAYVRTEDRLRVVAAGFQQYVSKPVDAAELRDVVLHLVSAGLQR